MKTIKTFVMGLAVAGLVSAVNAQTVFSGTALNSLDYSGGPGEAQYVPAAGPIPALAQLFTADSSVNGDSPALFATGPWGSLNAFSASYSLYSGSNGTPYWILYMADDPTFSSPIVGIGGSVLNGSSLVHVGDLNNGSITVSALDSTIDPISNVTYGQETVAYAGIEIGDGGSGATVANFDSITIVPEPTTVMLVGTGLMGMLLVARRRKKV